MFLMYAKNFSCAFLYIVNRYLYHMLNFNVNIIYIKRYKTHNRNQHREYIAASADTAKRTRIREFG